jgi:hypothetical protein
MVNYRAVNGRLKKSSGGKGTALSLANKESQLRQSVYEGSSPNFRFWLFSVVAGTWPVENCQTKDNFGHFLGRSCNPVIFYPNLLLNSCGLSHSLAGFEHRLLLARSNRFLGK